MNMHQQHTINMPPIYSCNTIIDTLHSTTTTTPNSAPTHTTLTSMAHAKWNTTTMQQNSIYQWTPPSPEFHGHNSTYGFCGFGMTQVGKGHGCSNRTPMEEMVELPASECNAIIALPHSNNSTTGTIASAVDMILIME